MRTRLAAVPVVLFAGAVLAAVLTPSPDALAMLALAVPLWALLYALFEVGLFLRRRRSRGKSPGPGEAD